MVGLGWQLPNPLYLQVLEHCRKEYPKEACGFLIANAAGVIEKVQPMKNVENSPIGYSMDPKEQLLVEKKIRENNQKIMVIYHSHTANAAVPSPVDITYAISPDISYAIVSLQDKTQPDLRSYRIYGDKVQEERVFRV